MIFSKNQSDKFGFISYDDMKKNRIKAKYLKILGINLIKIWTLVIKITYIKCSYIRSDNFMTFDEEMKVVIGNNLINIRKFLKSKNIEISNIDNLFSRVKVVLGKEQ